MYPQPPYRSFFNFCDSLNELFKTSISSSNSQYDDLSDILHARLAEALERVPATTGDADLDAWLLARHLKGIGYEFVRL